jgi:hypothetical protein
LGSEASPIWSPDGKTVVFSNNGLFRKDATGSADPQRITELGRLREPSDWSPTDSSFFSAKVTSRPIRTFGCFRSLPKGSRWKENSLKGTHQISASRYRPRARRLDVVALGA